MLQIKEKMPKDNVITSGIMGKFDFIQHRNRPKRAHSTCRGPTCCRQRRPAKLKNMESEQSIEIRKMPEQTVTKR